MNQESLVLYDPIFQCLTLAGVAAKEGRHVTTEDLGIIENAAMVVNAENTRIIWI